MASPIVRLSRKRGRRTSREPKAKSVKQPTSPLFQQGQATTSLNIVESMQGQENLQKTADHRQADRC